MLALVNNRMLSEITSCKPEDRWYFVRLISGSSAAVSNDDLDILVQTGLVYSAVRVCRLEAIALEASRAADMSANHRIKAGESGGVG